MSEVGHADARNEVHVGLALGVVEVDALSPHKFQGQGAEGRGSQGMQKALAEVHTAKVRGG